MSSVRGNTGVFGYVGRRLALLNAGVVLMLIAVVGVAMVAFARYTLIEQEDDSLAAQASVAALNWAPMLTSGQTLPVLQPPAESEREGEEHEDEHEEDEAHELLESGDTIPLGFDADGNLIANPRNLTWNGLPDRAAVARALSGQSSHRTVAAEDAGSIRVYTMPIRVEGRIVGAVQVARSQKQVRSAIRTIELAALAGAAIGALGAVPTGLFLAKRAMRPIDRAFRRQQSFIADASHELRTPLAVMRANTELVRRMPDAPAQERDRELALVLDEVDRMARLVDDLLVLARSDAGRLAVRADVADLSQIVREAVQPMEALASQAGHTLVVDAAEEILISADEDRLAQVLRILVDNAISYTPAGGLITVTTRATPDRAVVTVADTGAGMSAEEQKRVFDRFYRGDHSRSRSGGGVGLGLSIAQAIARAHNGSLEIESEKGAGTTVRLSIPRFTA